MLARSPRTSTGHCLAPRLALFLVLCLSLVVAGCGGSKKAAPKDEEPEMTAEEVAAEVQKRRLESIKSNFERAKKLVRKNPTDFFTNTENLQGILVGAMGTRYEEDIQAEIDQQEQGLKDFADKQLDELMVEVETHMSKKDWDEAERTLIRFAQNEDAFRALPAWNRYEEMIEEIKIKGMAEGEARTLLGRATKYKLQGETARAIGMLVAFPNKYRDTSEYAQIEETIASYMEDYRVERAERDKEDAVPFVDLEMDEYLSNFHHVMLSGDVTVWNGVDGVAEGDNSGELPAPLVLGTSEWENWTVEFTVKYTGDEPFRLGVTAGETRFSRGKQQWATYPFPDLDEDEWHTLRVIVSDGEIEVRDVTTGSKLKEGVPKANATGGIAFFIMPGQKMFLKDVRYKIVSKIEAPKEEGGDDEGGDGEGDG